jgi:hypothetical protein
VEHEDLIRRLVEIVEEMKRMHDANQIDLEDPNARFVQLVIDGHTIKKELDPLLSAIFRDRPAELAEWNTIAHAFDGLAKLGREEDRKSDSNSTDPDEETDPRIAELIADGNRILKELDPIVREEFRDHAKELAEWDSIMQKYYELDKEESGESDS